MYCRIRLKDTNYQEYENFRMLDSSYYKECLEIYRKYVEYKEFDDVVPIFKEEFETHHCDVLGYYDQNHLVAFTLAYRFDSLNSVWGDQFAWDYENPKLSMGHIANKHEFAYYKRLGYDYYYLGPAMSYKEKLQGYEIADVSKTYKFVNNHIIWH